MPGCKSIFFFFLVFTGFRIFALLAGLHFVFWKIKKMQKLRQLKIKIRQNDGLTYRQCNNVIEPPIHLKYPFHQDDDDDEKAFSGFSPPYSSKYPFHQLWWWKGFFRINCISYNSIIGVLVEAVKNNKQKKWFKKKN